MDREKFDVLTAAVEDAQAAGEPLCLRGAGTKAFLGESSVGRPLSVAEHRGVIAYEPSELVLTARAGTPFDPEIPIGLMIEVPSAALTADILARECDFFSIGTNDLIQYSLAIDRNNEHVAYLYDPLHLSNLRALQRVAEAARAAKIPVGLCGEMAADPRCTAVCLALGFDSLSMPLSAIPRVKYALRRMSLDDSRALLEECLTQGTVQEIRRLVDEAAERLVPELFAE